MKKKKKRKKNTESRENSRHAKNTRSISVPKITNHHPSAAKLHNIK